MAGIASGARPEPFSLAKFSQLSHPCLAFHWVQFFRDLKTSMAARVSPAMRLHSKVQRAH